MEEKKTAEGELPESKPAAGGGKKIWAEALDWFDTVSGSILAIILIFVLFTRLSTVDGSSMLPTLHNQERILVTDFMYTPAHNDIVVLWEDGLYNGISEEYGKALVKRVIGIAGDTIEIDFESGTVYRNGEALPHEIVDGVLFEDGHAINDFTRERLDMQGPVTVPEGCVFVMGDNRNDSTDSRDTRVGMVDVNNIVGKVYLRIMPLDVFGGVV